MILGVTHCIPQGVILRSEAHYETKHIYVLYSDREHIENGNSNRKQTVNDESCSGQAYLLIEAAIQH